MYNAQPLEMNKVGNSYSGGIQMFRAMKSLSRAHEIYANSFDKLIYRRLNVPRMIYQVLPCLAYLGLFAAAKQKYRYNKYMPGK